MQSSRKTQAAVQPNRERQGQAETLGASTSIVKEDLRVDTSQPQNNTSPRSQRLVFSPKSPKAMQRRRELAALAAATQRSSWSSASTIRPPVSDATSSKLMDPDKTRKKKKYKIKKEPKGIRAELKGIIQMPDGQNPSGRSPQSSDEDSASVYSEYDLPESSECDRISAVDGDDEGSDNKKSLRPRKQEDKRPQSRMDRRHTARKATRNLASVTMQPNCERAPFILHHASKVRAQR